MAYQIIASQDTDAVYPETELRPRITAVLDSAADVEALGGTEKWSPGSLAILAEAGFPTLLLSKSNGWVNGNTGGSGGSGLPSGSSPNQYLVTDSEGNAKWEDKIAWSEKEVILEEQTINLNEDAYTVTEVDNIVVGESYVVGYQGNEYICVAREFSMDGNTTTIIGNSYILGDDEADSGEPFVYVAIPQEFAAQLGFSGYFEASGSDPDSIVASIRKETIHPIDKKYLPSVKIIYGNVDQDDRYLYHDEAYTTKVSADELMEMLGGVLFIKAKNPDGTNAVCYTLRYFYEDESGGIVVALRQPLGSEYATIEYYTKEIVFSGPQ